MGGTLALLRHVLVTAEQRAAAAANPGALENDGYLLGELQDIPGLFVPSAAVLGIVIAVYVLLIAPLTFVVLWRRRHAALAWVLVPAVAVTTTAVMMATGLGTAGHDAALNVVRVVTVDPQTGTARVQTLAALFSQHGGSRLIQIGAAADAMGLAGVQDRLRWHRHPSRAEQRARPGRRTGDDTGVSPRRRRSPTPPRSSTPHSQPPT